MKANNELFGVKVSASSMDVVYVNDDNTARRIRKAISMVESTLPTKTLLRLANKVVNSAGINLKEVVASFNFENSMMVY